MGRIEDVKKDHHFVFQKYMEEYSNNAPGGSRTDESDN